MVAYIGLDKIRNIKRQMADRLMAEYKPRYVLKTDAYNERINRPLVTAFADAHEIFLVEQNGGTLLKAINKVKMSNLKGYTASIINIPIPKEIIDLVYESSTINHMNLSELGMAFKEFHRLLMPSGILITFPWISDTHFKSQHKGWEDISYIYTDYFNRYYEPLFDTIEHDIISTSIDGYAELHYYIAKKKETQHDTTT